MHDEWNMVRQIYESRFVWAEAAVFDEKDIMLRLAQSHRGEITKSEARVSCLCRIDKAADSLSKVDLVQIQSETPSLTNSSTPSRRRSL